VSWHFIVDWCGATFDANDVPAEVAYVEDQTHLRIAVNVAKFGRPWPTEDEDRAVLSQQEPDWNSDGLSVLSHRGQPRNEVVAQPIFDSLAVFG
jgi:hypothetical protein